jgi:SAM-dependent methyltransferase
VPNESWKFDKSIAGVFVDHARKHIPNYETVIQKAINLTNLKLKKTDKILDFGCATGRTLELFKLAGYDNLYGIDNSQAMLDQCNIHADYLCSGTVPESYKDFNLILSNWTLHFSDTDVKVSILKNIYSALVVDGYFVVSEKVTEDPELIDLYYEWKFFQGVSREEIELKKKQLVGVMKPESHEWWLKTLTLLGFRKIAVIDADWCFTTFMCIK